jgi:hypothetical protein
VRPVEALELDGVVIRVRGLNDFQGHFFRAGHSCFGREGQGWTVQFQRRARAAARRLGGNWGAKGEYSLKKRKKNAASKGEKFHSDVEA